MKKLFLVDDDLEYGRELIETLKQHGLHVQMVANGSDCLRVLELNKFDAILLDWNLPDMTGLDICRKFRQDGGKTPIIFLTGRDDVDDKEAGLDSGGDDYLTKPFQVKELLARLRSIERRTANFEKDSFTVQDVELKPNLRMVFKGDQKARLSLIESEILAFLFENRDTFVNSGQIFAALWPADSETDESVVRSHVKLLRKRLSRIAADNIVETVPGAGYIVRSEPV